VKETLIKLLDQALQDLGLTAPAKGIQIERTRDAAHGDFASNVALLSAKAAGMAPREVADKIVAALPTNSVIEKIEIAGPGFINFHLQAAASFAVIDEILGAGAAFGRLPASGEKLHIEFVSANPTGPLHVGHGRGAAYGATLANLLEAAGYQVHREYYVNDAGRQMDILATSVWIRLLEAAGEPAVFPTAGYRGEYILEIAASLPAEPLTRPWAEVIEAVPADGEENAKEAHIDGLIAQAKTLLGDDYWRVFNAAKDSILNDIRTDLAEFGVDYDEWFSERSLIESKAAEQAVQSLKDTDHLYEKDGALWFKSEALGDNKDRVVIRDNGQATYFANDIAYHLNKFKRGFDQVVDVWGADHHGYIARVKGSLTASGQDADKLDVRLVQFAVLWRGSEKVQMSTRSGEFVTLRQLRQEVGNDAARFFYVMRSADQHLDFDLELAKSNSNDNPVYYIQYAHARVCSVLRQLAERELAHEPANAELSRLTETHETELLTALQRYPETLAFAASNHAPHTLAHYLRDLAQALHSYYNAHHFIVDDAALRNARLSLILATRQVIANGLGLLGVSAPEQM